MGREIGKEGEAVWERRRGQRGACRGGVNHGTEEEKGIEAAGEKGIGDGG